MKETTKRKIKESGLMTGFLANKISVHPTQFSLAYTGKRLLPSGKEEELIAFLNKVLPVLL